MSQVHNNVISHLSNAGSVNLESSTKPNEPSGLPLTRDVSLPNLNPQPEEDQSQFLELNPEMQAKLRGIDSSKYQFLQKKRSRPAKGTQLNKSLDARHMPSLHKQALPRQKRRVENKESQMEIKKQFVHKLKEWELQKEEFEHKKHVLQNHRQKLKKEKEDKKRQEQEEEIQFHKLEKKKLLERKINEIGERRRRRETSLININSKPVPKYVSNQQQFVVKEEERALLDLKLMRNKKEKMKMSPEELKAHEKAYVERIKERLQMKPKQKQSDQHSNSDFNLYLKRNEDSKKAELEKNIRRKKFQEKLSRMAVRVNSEKKQEILITIDKAKNPQKYHILERKALNDQQIYQQFKGFEIDMDAKKMGNDNLNHLKAQKGKNKPENSPEPKTQERTANMVSNKVGNKVSNKRTARSQELQRKQEPQSLPKLSKVRVQPDAPRSERLRPSRKSSIRTFSQLSVSQSYERSLVQAKERDSKYMSVLNSKLAHLY